MINFEQFKTKAEVIKKIKEAMKKRRVQEKEKEKPEQLCEYAIPGKEISKNYSFPYKCGVMFECRYKHPTQKITKNCPRRQIGDIRKEEKHEQKTGESNHAGESEETEPKRPQAGAVNA